MSRGDGEPGRRRGRPPKDPQVILEALERLLADRPLHELSVEDVLGAANVSRATFYAHFPTKFSAATALLHQIASEITDSMSAYVARPDEVPVLDALRTGVDDAAAVWLGHGSLLRTVVDNAHAVREFAEALGRIKHEFAVAVAGEIERERAAGVAPPGHDALELSRALVECSIHLLHSVLSDEPGGVPGPPAVQDLIYAIWCGTVYRLEPPTEQSV